MSIMLLHLSTLIQLFQRTATVCSRGNSKVFGNLSFIGQKYDGWLIYSLSRTFIIITARVVTYKF